MKFCKNESSTMPGREMLKLKDDMIVTVAGGVDDIVAFQPGSEPTYT